MPPTQFPGWRGGVRLLVAWLLLTLFAVAGARADDWPQWRGPERDGKSPQTGLLKRWPDAGPKLVWKSDDAGVGYSAPSVADGKVFVMGNGAKKEWIVCLDEQTGKQVWACSTGRVRFGGGGFAGPRSTPTVAGGCVYGMGLAGRLVACDEKTGQPLWWRSMLNLGGKLPHWGYCESVLVDGGHVICTPGLQKTVVALDAKSGKDIWAAAAGDPAAYSSPVKAVFGETPQYVVFTQRGVIGIRAADGAVLWRYDGPSNGQVNCPTPVVVGSTVFAASGYGKGGGCAEIRKDTADAFTAKELYFTSRMQNQHGGFVVVGEFLYGCSDPGMLVCLNYKTGAVAKAIRTGRFSIASADGMLYLRGEDGRVDLYEASPTALARRGSFQQPNRSKLKAWPHPVIANGRLYLRDQTVLLCYDISGAPPKSPPAGAKAKAPAGNEKAKTPVENETPKPPPEAEKKAPAGAPAKDAIEP